MGDVGEAFRALREHTQAERAERSRINTETLDASEFRYAEVQDGVYRFAVPGRPRVDFYPATNKWQVLATREIHRGDAHDFVRWYRHQHILAPRLGGNRAPY